MTTKMQGQVHIYKLAGTEGQYVAPSCSDANVAYFLHVDDDTVSCSCKGYTYRATCKHSKAVQEMLADLPTDEEMDRMAGYYSQFDLKDLY